jgi:TolB protein
MDSNLILLPTRIKNVIRMSGLVLALSLSLSSCSSGQPELTHSAVPVAGIAFTSERDGQRELYLIQPDGSGLTRLTDHESVDSDPAFSPDRTLLAFRSRRDGSSDIFIMAADGSSTPINIFPDPAESFDDEFQPKWHPDGNLLAVFTDRFLPPMGNCRTQAGVHHLAFIPLDAERPTINHFDDLAGEQETLTWSPDGSALAFGSICRGNHVQVQSWDAISGQVTALTAPDFGSAGPDFAPDGRFLAFTSGRDGPSDIFILDLMSGELRNLTQSQNKDRQPSWSPDGTMIAFTRNEEGNDDIYIIVVATGETLRLTQHPARDLLADWGS